MYKATAGEIPINVLKNCENCFSDLNNCINKAIRNKKFPDSLKLSGIPQGSILGQLLFNIFINNIFFFVEKSEICNFADDNTVYSCGKDLAKIKEDMICTIKNVLKWFMLNSLKANPGKFQFIILGDKTCYKHILKINSTCVQSSDDVTLLGVMIDKNLTFKKHVGNLVRQAQYELYALQRIRKFLTIEKAKILDNAFIDSQFNYAPLIWMLCRKTLYSKIQKIHHNTLKVVYGIDDSYKNLLFSSNSVSIHQRHLRFLVTEMFKSISQINPEFMWSFFKPKELSYNLRKEPILNLPKTQSTFYGTNAIHFRGSLIWNKLPAKVKSSNSVFEFKTKIKNLGNIDCGCLICR